MFDLDGYLNDLISSCREAFGERLLYVGLQGSRMRGEAHENSDIDVMVILDRLSVPDMDRYREILKRLGFWERSCGFICGRDELLRWNPLEVCQLRYTTKDLLGVLTDYLPSAAWEDEVNYVKLSLGNLYHELCHRYIHADRERNIAAFRGTCKGVFFLMQNLHFLESGRFITTKGELKEAVSVEDRRVLELAELPDGFDFDQAFSVLLAWCQSVFPRLERLVRKTFPVRPLRSEEYTSTLIAVSDMERSKQFYHDVLGMNVVADFGANVTLDGGLVLQTMDTWKSFIRTDKVVLPNNAGELYFEEEDMDGFCDHLKKFEICYVHPLFEHRWGQRVVRFYDPDKHIIEVGEKLDTVILRFIEQGLSAEETATRMDIPLDFVTACLDKSLYPRRDAQDMASDRPQEPAEPAEPAKEPGDPADPADHGYTASEVMKG